MNNIALLKSQHQKIQTQIETIEAFINTAHDFDANSIAYNINALAGMLKMHLLSEDQFLYPVLTQSQSPMIKITAQRFYREMGGLSKAFLTYVNQYNIPSKINGNKDRFLLDTQKIIHLIKERIRKEDEGLYSYIKL